MTSHSILSFLLNTVVCIVTWVSYPKVSSLKSKSYASLSCADECHLSAFRTLLFYENIQRKNSEVTSPVLWKATFRPNRRMKMVLKWRKFISLQNEFIFQHWHHLVLYIFQTLYPFFSFYHGRKSLAGFWPNCAQQTSTLDLKNVDLSTPLNFRLLTIYAFCWLQSNFTLS